MSGRIGKQCHNCGSMVYLHPPVRGDKTLSEALTENRRLKLELQTATAELHRLQHCRGNFRALLEMFKRETHKIFG